MKNILTFCILLIVCNSFSQETLKSIEELLSTDRETNQNTYFTDDNGKLQACVGTWVYNNGVDYFKVKITKEKVLYSEKYNVYIDALIIKYDYRKNGVCKYYNISSFNIPTGANSQPSDLKSSFVKNDEITFPYYEPSFTSCQRRKIGILDIKLVTGTTNQLQWKRTTPGQWFRNEPCSDGTPIDNSDFIIPANMVLIKQ